MHIRTLTRSLGLLCLLFAVSLLLTTCKKTEASKNGPPKDFIKCKIDGVDYQAEMIITDTGTEDSKLYFSATSFSKTQADIIVISFNTALPIGTYPASLSSGFDFIGVYTKNQAIDYYSSIGSITLTSVTDRYEGSFEFIGDTDPGQGGDTVFITSGTFSLKKK